MLDMIETSERTRSGDCAAMVCAIMPPIERPTTWARSISRWSSSPLASRAMSASVYAGRRMRLVTSSRRVGGGESVRCVERPLSRLSKRIT